VTHFYLSNLLKGQNLKAAIPGGTAGTPKTKTAHDKLGACAPRKNNILLGILDWTKPIENPGLNPVGSDRFSLMCLLV
jgi:hypothetical protein